MRIFLIKAVDGEESTEELEEWLKSVSSKELAKEIIFLVNCQAFSLEKAKIARKIALRIKSEDLIHYLIYFIDIQGIAIKAKTGLAKELALKIKINDLKSKKAVLEQYLKAGNKEEKSLIKELFLRI